MQVIDKNIVFNRRAVMYSREEEEDQNTRGRMKLFETC